MLKSDLAQPLTLASLNDTPKVSVVQPDWIARCVLVLIAAVPTVALWGKSSYLTGDSYQYLRAALTFAQGQGLRDMSGESFTVLTPFYSLVIGIGHWLFPKINVETIARLISFAGATTAVIAFYSLLRLRFAVLISVLVASVFALMPLRVWMGVYALSEGLYVGLLLLGLAIFFRAQTRPGLVAIAGALIGAAYLTRPEAFLCATGLVVVSLFAREGRIRRTIVFCAAFLVVAVPYHAWVYRETGTIRSNRFQILLAQSQALYEGNTRDVYVFNQANADGTASPILKPEMSTSLVVKRYFYYAWLEIKRLLYLVGPRLLVMSLMVVGCAIFLWRVVRRRVRFHLADTWPVLLAAWLLLLPLFHVEDRYLLPVAPAILFWLALATAGIHEFIASRWNFRKVARAIPIVIAAAFFLSYSYRLTTQLPRADESLLERNTANWLETQKLSAAPIISQGPGMAFFANSKHIWMANGEPESVLTYAHRSGAAYVFVTTRDVATPLNQLLLGNEDQFPKSLNLLHETTDGSARARLFKFN